jgi:hypothetical protein
MAKKKLPLAVKDYVRMTHDNEPRLVTRLEKFNKETEEWEAVRKK